MFDDERSGGGGGGDGGGGGGGEVEVEVELSPVGTSGRSGASPRPGAAGWREIDRQLRRVAKTRGGLDADELVWLARAARAEIHRQFGYATIQEYVERVLGHGPRVARDRLRVARALETMPGLRAELESGRLAYSAIREVSRVARPWNEDRWIERIAGKSLREIEDTLAGHQPGDDPEDEPKPDLALRPITFELTPRTLALFREAARMLEDEVGHPMTDDQLFATLCASALREERPPVMGGDDASPARPGEPEGDEQAHPGTDEMTDEGRRRPREGSAPPAPYQIALTLCRACKRATHDAAGRSFDVSRSVLEQAMCNAQYLGQVDAEVPARAKRDIPPATVRLVWRRDGGRCVVPGCRSTRHIEVHHIRFRRDGVDHSPGNLVCLCTLCRARHNLHYAAWRIMPRRAGFSTERLGAYAA